MGDRHLRFGWWSLLFFLTLGGVLETLHGFKLGWYLDVGNETRRLMWTLAHAHGALLALVHIVFALTVGRGGGSGGKRRMASRLLMASSLLLPGGFFLAGAVVHGGDPDLGILLVPLGALALFVAVALTASEV